MMRQSDELTNGVLGFADTSNSETQQFLRQISHDASTPLSTIALETYSARLILQRAIDAGSPEDRVILLEVQEILGNIHAASRTLTGLLSALTASTTQGQCAAISALGRPLRAAVHPATDAERADEAISGAEFVSAEESANSGAHAPLKVSERVSTKS